MVIGVNVNWEKWISCEKTEVWKENVKPNKKNMPVPALGIE